MNLLIIGCGRTGAGLAQTLTLRSHAVTVIDRDQTAFERLGPHFKGKTVTGSGIDREVLHQAGIEHADGLAAVSGADEINVVVARVASQVFRVPRVVARLYDPRKAEIYVRLGVQTVAPVTWGLHRMAELLSFSELHPTVSLGSGEVDLVEMPLPPRLAGRTVRDLTIPGEVHVAALTRGGKTFLPTLGTVLQPGDQVHLVVLAASADRLNALFALR
jgi:trk system potassium uptake protein TrkA